MKQNMGTTVAATAVPAADDTPAVDVRAPPHDAPAPALAATFFLPWDEVHMLQSHLLLHSV